MTVDGTELGAEVTDLDERVFDVGLYSNDNGDQFVNPEGLMTITEAIAWCDAALANPNGRTRASRRRRRAIA